MEEAFIIKKTHIKSFFKRFQINSQVYWNLFKPGATYEDRGVVMIQCMCINDKDMVAELVFKTDFLNGEERENE